MQVARQFAMSGLCQTRLVDEQRIEPIHILWDSKVVLAQLAPTPAGGTVVFHASHPGFLSEPLTVGFGSNHCCSESTLWDPYSHGIALPRAAGRPVDSDAVTVMVDPRIPSHSDRRGSKKKKLWPSGCSTPGRSALQVGNFKLR